MNEIVTNRKEDISSMIYEVRGVLVMLDSDLANIYNCSNGTKDINKAVKRNINRFPSDFYFELTKEETKIIYSRFQFGTLNRSNDLRGYNLKYLPHVFTEQGIAMLASVLHTSFAEEASIHIMRTFVAMRKYISSSMVNQKFINNLVYKHDEDIKLLKESFDKLQEKTKVNAIFFEGQIYDAYSLLLDILNIAKKEIIIIDNYAGKELLDILKEVNTNIKIYSSNINELLIKKYKSQYNNIDFVCNKSFHDRFIIIDKTILYHCGSSFKDLGKKCFAINKIESNNILNNILEELEINE